MLQKRIKKYNQLFTAGYLSRLALWSLTKQFPLPASKLSPQGDTKPKHQHITADSFTLTYSLETISRLQAENEHIKAPRCWHNSPDEGAKACEGVSGRIKPPIGICVNLF